MSDLFELAQGQRDLLLGGVGAELGELCLDDVGHVEQNLLGVARFDEAMPSEYFSDP